MSKYFEPNYSFGKYDIAEPTKDCQKYRRRVKYESNINVTLRDFKKWLRSHMMMVADISKRIFGNEAEFHEKRRGKLYPSSPHLHV